MRNIVFMQTLFIYLFYPIAQKTQIHNLSAFASIRYAKCIEEMSRTEISLKEKTYRQVSSKSTLRDVLKTSGSIFTKNTNVKIFF